MRRIRNLSICALLALSLAVPLTAITQNKTSSEKGCDSSTVDDWGHVEATKARAFLASLKSAVLANDKTKLAAMASYPLNVFADSGKRVIHNRAEFMQNYPRVFTAYMKDAVLKQSSDCLFGNAQGAMVGDGEIWFAEQYIQDRRRQRRRNTVNRVSGNATFRRLKV